MKILVLSDSHSGLSFMRRCIQSVKPDVMIHLGDHFDDGEAMALENPHIRIHQVPGNCDKYRCPPFAREILIMPVCGVPLYMTHGHLHHVKTDTWGLLKAARDWEAKVVLYGHTHVPNCYQDTDGLWILNPGSCGYFGGSAGLVEIENGRVIHCSILREGDL